MEYFIEGLLSESVTEVGEGAIGGGLKKVEVTEEAQPAIVT